MTVTCKTCREQHADETPYGVDVEFDAICKAEDHIPDDEWVTKDE